ncbi:MAG: GxxExxY protein [Bacteroidia bacterium]
MLKVEDPEIFYSKKEEFPLKTETYKIIGLAMEVHKALGKGFLETVYKDALELEFKWNKIPYSREKSFIIDYKGTPLKRFYVADFIGYEKIVIEIKAQDGIIDENFKQTINYLAVSKLTLGLILNFGEDSLNFKRVILTKK